MNSSQSKNQTKEKINPYEFIKLPDKKRKQYEDEDKHTGVIEYTIKTYTPLFIPNSSTDKAFKISDEVLQKKSEEHKSYDFYSYTMLNENERYDEIYHQPVIPGSEVRGMVRNLYETLTDSCMSGLSENEIPEVSLPKKFQKKLADVKIVKESTIGELAGEFAPCKDKNNMCPACALFGTIGEGIASASKLRFADLTPLEYQKEAKMYYDENVTLNILGQPMTGNTKKYLKKPQAETEFWSYNYYISKAGKVVSEPGVLSGRKYYWHYPKCRKLSKTPGVTSGKAENQNCSIRPLKSNTVFVGKIFFEDVSEKQLSELIWIVNGGNTDNVQAGKENNRVDICYKLGLAKPLGLGSVKCSVNRVVERVVELCDGSIQYKETDIAEKYIGRNYKENRFSKTNQDIILELCNYYSKTGVEIAYTNKKDSPDKSNKSYGKNNRSGRQYRR